MIIEKDAALKEHEGTIATLQLSIADFERRLAGEAARVADLERTVALREGQIGQMEELLAEKSRLDEERKMTIKERDARIGWSEMFSVVRFIHGCWGEFWE